MVMMMMERAHFGFLEGLSKIPWEKKNRLRGTDPFDGDVLDNYDIDEE